jgi:hypothetical protein
MYVYLRGYDYPGIGRILGPFASIGRARAVAEREADRLRSGHGTAYVVAGHPCNEFARVCEVFPGALVGQP